MADLNKALVSIIRCDTIFTHDRKVLPAPANDHGDVNSWNILLCKRWTSNLRGPMQYSVLQLPSSHCLKCWFSKTHKQLPCCRLLHRSASVMKCSEDSRLVNASAFSSNFWSIWTLAATKKLIRSRIPAFVLFSTENATYLFQHPGIS